MCQALISLIPSLTTGTKSAILPTPFIDGKTEMFPNWSKSYICNTNSILTLVRLQDFNLFSDPLFYRWKTRLETWLWSYEEQIRTRSQGTSRDIRAH